MGRNVWDVIKQSKDFYVRTYRITGNLLVGSFSIMLLLIAGLLYSYANTAQIVFYTTNSEHYPMLLHAMEHPNYSSEALLGNEIQKDRQPVTHFSGSNQ